MLQSGTVKRVLTKPWQNKTLYSVSLVNQQPLFGFGTHNPKVNEGDQVEFEADLNPKGYMTAKAGSLVVKDRVPEGTHSAAQAAPTARNGAAPSMGKDDYWARKEARDAKQDELREIGATRNTAIEWIKILLDKEALKLPVKAASREEFLQQLLADYVDKFRGIIKEKAATEAKAVSKETAPEAADADEGEDKWA